MFSRPFPEQLEWLRDGADPQADLWATAEQTRDDVIGLYRRAGAHSDATITALDLDAAGQVPWWPPERRDVTLHQVLVHLVAETDRHAGHADVVRELIDGGVGRRPGAPSVPERGEASWATYRERLQVIADGFV